MNLPAFITNWIARVRFDIRDPGGTVYMRRYRFVRTRWFNVYVHHILRSDWARDCHDHPWPFLSLILRGGYYEQTLTRKTWCPAGRMLLRPARWVHRVELGAFMEHVGTSGNRSVVMVKSRQAWSLVITGPRIRDWGFITPRGWCFWKKYMAGGCE